MVSVSKSGSRTVEGEKRMTLELALFFKKILVHYFPELKGLPNKYFVMCVRKNEDWLRDKTMSLTVEMYGHRYIVDQSDTFQDRVYIAKDDYRMGTLKMLSELGVSMDEQCQEGDGI